MHRQPHLCAVPLKLTQGCRSAVVQYKIKTQEREGSVLQLSFSSSLWLKAGFGLCCCS